MKLTARKHEELLQPQDIPRHVKLSFESEDQRGVEGHVILEANSEVLGRAELWAGSHVPRSRKLSLRRARPRAFVASEVPDRRPGRILAGSRWQHDGWHLRWYPLRCISSFARRGCWRWGGWRFLRRGSETPTSRWGLHVLLRCRVELDRVRALLPASDPPQAAGCRLHKGGARPSCLHTSTWMHLFLEGSLSRSDSYSLRTGSRHVPMTLTTETEMMARPG